MNNEMKIKFWRKLSTNNKLIFAIPQVVEMIDMLEAQTIRINQLEEAVSEVFVATNQHEDKIRNVYELAVGMHQIQNDKG